MFVEDEDGAVVWHREALVYARASLTSYRLPSIEQDVATLGRFSDFCRVFAPGTAVPADAVDYLVYAYLVWRHNGTVSDGSSGLGGLRWRPLASQPLRAEFRALARYFRFSALTWGHVSLGRFRQALGADALPLRRLKASDGMKERDFLVHLAASRDYWARQRGVDVQMPPVAVVANRGGSVRHVMPAEEVWTVIRAERNPVFRGLWLVGAFGGIRISEQLNAWQVDVLPATLRKPLFGSDAGDDILFLRADPVSSRYTGDVGKPGPTRRQYLADRYGPGFLPRPEYPRSHPLHAGWKRTLYLNGTLHLSEVFWVDGRAAALFAECAAEIRDFHRRHSTSERHPFFYVNVADPTGEFRGDILKIGNVEAAWDRACRRCGLEPHRWGRNIHGLRHFYKLWAVGLGLSAADIQIMMGHTRIASQHDYGKAAREAHTRLETARRSLQPQVPQHP